MNILRLVSTGTALLIVGGCADGGGAPTAPELTREGRSSAPTAASAARRIPASGSFAAVVDFSTLRLTPRGSNCLLQVAGQLVFSGTIQGPATGRTTALVSAPCADVAANPPGTFSDVFRSDLVFDGTVNGEPARAKLLYTGRVQPGGEITGRLIFSRGVEGSLNADAVVAVGGTYRGSVVVR